MIILAFPILGGNMFTPDVIWSLATCGLCIILLVVSHNEPWKREE